MEQSVFGLLDGRVSLPTKPSSGQGVGCPDRNTGIPRHQTSPEPDGISYGRISLRWWGRGTHGFRLIRLPYLPLRTRVDNTHDAKPTQQITTKCRKVAPRSI